MSVGMILLTATAILVFFGAAQRVLDKLHLTDRMALLLIAAMFLGTLVPNLVIRSVSVSIGGAVIPTGICIYLLCKADTARERVRALIGAGLTAIAIYALSAFMPDEPENIILDPLYAYGIAGGAIAYLLGRSRRAAFICGVLGVLLADTAVAAVNRFNGIEQQLVLGGGGVFDAVVISGLIGVILCELVGEIIERFARGQEKPSQSRIVHPINRKER